MLSLRQELTRWSKYVPAPEQHFPPDPVQAILPNTRQDLFHDDASYLLIGGLGGIGRAIALWMADHGARHLTLVNRSGLSTESGKSTVAGLQAKGVCVTVQACDISDEGEVNKMILDIQRQRPPIRGVIQGAMVLKVCTFMLDLDSCC